MGCCQPACPRLSASNSSNRTHASLHTTRPHLSPSPPPLLNRVLVGDGGAQCDARPQVWWARGGGRAHGRGRLQRTELGLRARCMLSATCAWRGQSPQQCAAHVCSAAALCMHVCSPLLSLRASLLSVSCKVALLIGHQIARQRSTGEEWHGSGCCPCVWRRTSGFQRAVPTSCVTPGCMSAKKCTAVRPWSVWRAALRRPAQGFHRHMGTHLPACPARPHVRMNTQGGSCKALQCAARAKTVAGRAGLMRCGGAPAYPGGEAKGASAAGRATWQPPTSRDWSPGSSGEGGAGPGVVGRGPAFMGELKAPTACMLVHWT